MTAMTAHQDFSALVAAATANRKPVSLDHARQALGELFEEHELAHETLVIRGDHYALTPTAWLRLVQRAQTKHARRPL